MNSPDQDELDPLLRQFFEDGFAAQLGRSNLVFDAELNASRTKRGRRTFGWAALAVSTLAAAAAVAIAVARPGSVHPAATKHAAPVIATSNDSHDVRYANYTQAHDDGVVIVNGVTPFRCVRFDQVEQMSWSDGKNQMRVTVPDERVVFVECPKY